MQQSATPDTGAPEGRPARLLRDEAPSHVIINPADWPPLVLRLLGPLAVIGAMSLAVVMYLQGADVPIILAAQGGLLVLLTVVADGLLHWAKGRLRRERESALRIWSRRQAELREIASRDDLTQLQNRRFFYEHLQQELEWAEQHRKPLSVVMMDVDDLKALNDEFGHQVGDIVLGQFARILNRHVRPNDVTARLGGDEFAVILPDTDRREAERFAWRVWEELAAAPVYENGHASIYLGVSMGIGGFPWGGTDLEEIIHWADAKLYANKLERKGFSRGSDNGADNRLASAVVDVLSTALDIRDRMTHRHARRVARMAAQVARYLHLPEEEVSQIEYAAALHDIGKIGVADSILRKPAPLDDEEWRDMRRHSELGYEILKGIGFLQKAAEIVYAHHERWDGTGYPKGLIGEEIPLGARVFAVVDAYDAMTSRRPYRKAVSRDVACLEIARNAGKQFDPQVVDVFLTVIRRSPEEELGAWEGFGPRVEVTKSRRGLRAAVSEKTRG